MNFALNRFVNLFFLSYIILHPAINSLLFSFDGAGRSIIILVFMVLLLNLFQSDFLRMAKSRPVLIWGMWSVYVTVTTLFIGVKTLELSSVSFIVNFILVPFVALWVSCYESYKDSRLLTKVLLLSFAAYCVLGCVFQDRAVADARGSDLLGNDLPLTAVSMLAVAAFRFVKKWDKPILFLAYVLLCTFSVVLAATRKAFAGEIIILFAVAFSFFDLKKITNFIPLVIVLCCLYFGISYVLENTLLGARFAIIDDDAAKFNTTDNPLLNMVGDRAYFYITGWELFTRNPLCGIGLFNFPAVTGGRMPIHSEYVVQLCEAGLIGSILFIMYNYFIFSNVNKIRNVPGGRPVWFVGIGWLLVLLFISFTAWTYQFPRYFIVTGLFVGYCSSLLRSSHDNI